MNEPLPAYFWLFNIPWKCQASRPSPFLRHSLNSVRKARGEEELLTPDFMRLVKAKAAGTRRIKPTRCSKGRSMSDFLAVKKTHGSPANGYSGAVIVHS